MEGYTTQTSNAFGSLLKAELERRGISQKDFAEAFGLKSSNLSGILHGRRKIPVSLIPVVSEMLNITESVIINSQKNFSTKAPVSEKESKEELEAMAELDSFEKIVSLKSLLRGHTTLKSTPVEKLQILREYYGLTSASDLQRSSQSLTENCFRRSDKTGLDQIMITTWVVKAKAEALKPENIPDRLFDIRNMEQLAKTLSETLHKNSGNTPKKVKILLNSYGIGYLEIKKEPKASIDGYSFLMNGTPYIAVTRRFDRIDNYAFNIMHELGHLFYGHVDETGKINVTLPISESTENFPSHEEEADRFATEKLLPNSIWFLAPTVPLNPYVIQKKYSAWAKAKGLNPWIVLGRVSYETGMYRFTSDSSRVISKGKEGVSMIK